MQLSVSIWWRHNKSKMADGRHIENVFSAISRRHIGRSTRNLEQRLRITCRHKSRDQNCNFRKFKMADGRHFENSIISISQPRIVRSNLVSRCTFQFPWWTFNKNGNFSNSRWRTDAILKMFLAISRPHIDRLMRNLDRKYRITWQYRTHDQNCNFRKLKMADERHIEYRFGYISAPYWPINAKFGKEMKNHTPIQVAWPKLQFSKVQDGGRPPFWK